MLTKLFLALRNNGHQVKVLTPNGETRPVLGRAHPEEEAEAERRANVMRQWGKNPDSPRAARQAAIDEPLSQRTQTILSHQLPQAERARLNGGVGAPANRSRRPAPDAEQSVPLRPLDADSESE